MTDKPTPKEIENLFVEETGFDIDDFPAAILDFARAVLAKWGQPAHSGEPVYAFRRKGLDDFCTCTEKRYAELSDKPTLFETHIFYTAPQPVEREPLIRQMLKALEQSQPFTEACANGKRMQWWGAQLDRAQDAINAARARLEEKP